MYENEAYTCTLDERSLRVAQDELNEDPKERLSQVETLRQWIKAQKHIKCPTDTIFLLKYLRTAKFSQLRAREILESYLRAKTENPAWLNDVDTTDKEFVRFARTGYMLPLPKKDPKGRLIILLRPGTFEPDTKQWDRDAIIKTVFGMNPYFVMDEGTMVNGIIFLQDFTGLSSKFLTFWGIDRIKKTTQLWQGNFPGRFKQFHYYNPGSLLETVMAIIKPVLKKKFQERIQVHGKNLEDLYKVIPMEYLPQDYLPDDYTGPSQGTLDNILENFVRDLQAPKIRDYIKYTTGAQWKYDFALKPVDVPSESFRKLNVD